MASPFAPTVHHDAKCIRGELVRAFCAPKTSSSCRAAKYSSQGLRRGHGMGTNYLSWTSTSTSTTNKCLTRHSTTVRAETKRAPAPVGTISSSAANLTKEEAKDLYRDMRLGREFEEMCAQMYYRGKMFGFVHLYSGQEAVSSGVIRLLNQDDYVCSTYRDHVHALSKNVPPREIMAELFGKKTGICRGQRALGDSTARQVSVNFFGDGTANNGQFYECLNMASLYKLPCIFVVENNKWAIGMNHPRATGATLGDTEPFIYKKGPAFGMPGVLVDGMDVRKVRAVAAEAIERARRGDGPTLIEAETYRFRGHSLADPDELRLKSEKEAYQARDPIPALRKYIIKEGLMSEAEIKAIDKEVVDTVEESVTFADESPKPKKGQLLENVFADPKGFGIAADGSYKFEDPNFSSGTANV